MYIKLKKTKEVFEVSESMGFRKIANGKAIECDASGKEIARNSEDRTVVYVMKDGGKPIPVSPIKADKYLNQKHNWFTVDKDGKKMEYDLRKLVKEAKPETDKQKINHLYSLVEQLSNEVAELKSIIAKKK